MTATNLSCRPVAASLSQTMVHLASLVKVWSAERSFQTYLWTNWEWRLSSFMPSIGSFSSLCLKVRTLVKLRSQSTSTISCSRSWRSHSTIGSKWSAMTSSTTFVLTAIESCAGWKMITRYSLRFSPSISVIISTRLQGNRATAKEVGQIIGGATVPLLNSSSRGPLMSLRMLWWIELRLTSSDRTNSSFRIHWKLWFIALMMRKRSSISNFSA